MGIEPAPPASEPSALPAGLRRQMISTAFHVLGGLLWGVKKIPPFLNFVMFFCVKKDFPNFQRNSTQNFSEKNPRGVSGFFSSSGSPVAAALHSGSLREPPEGVGWVGAECGRVLGLTLSRRFESPAGFLFNHPPPRDTPRGKDKEPLYRTGKP